MTIPEKVFAFLVDHKPARFCDDCIQKRLSLKRRQEVAPITNTLGLSSGFARDPGRCVSFHSPRTKLVIHAL